MRHATGVVGALTLGFTLVPATSVAAAPSRPADNGAKIVKERRLNSRTLEITMHSPAVGKRVKALVLLPKGWKRTAKRTWPTVYMYAGGGGDDDTTWVRQTDLRKVAARWNVMVVLPYNSNFGGFVDHYNYGRGGRPRWETHHTVEVRQLVERNLRAGTRRAVMGISAGALGAMAYAGRHPRLFKYAAAFSGTLHILKPGVPQILMVLNARAGNDDPYKIWGIPHEHRANWEAHNPYHLAHRLRGVGLYVSSGTTGERGPLDPKNLSEEDALRHRLLGGLSEQVTGDTSKSFVARLRQLKIPVTAHFYGNGWHAWPYWQREMHYAWPKAMKAIGAKRA